MSTAAPSQNCNSCPNFIALQKEKQDIEDMSQEFQAEALQHKKKLDLQLAQALAAHAEVVALHKQTMNVVNTQMADIDQLKARNVEMLQRFAQDKKSSDEKIAKLEEQHAVDKKSSDEKIEKLENKTDELMRGMRQMQDYASETASLLIEVVDAFDDMAQQRDPSSLVATIKQANEITKRASEHVRAKIFVEGWNHTCAQCGEPARKRCGACKQVYYCSRNCQMIHWKSVHKSVCLGSVD